MRGAIAAALLAIGFALLTMAAAITDNLSRDPFDGVVYGILAVPILIAGILALPKEPNE